MTEQTDTPTPVEVDPALEAAAELGLTPPEQITVMTVRVNGLGASTWQYSMPHESASAILREIADAIDAKAAEIAEAAETAETDE